jgi:hypothetical protein
MGVNHLKQGAKMAAAQASGGNTGKSPESTQVQALNRPAETSGTISVPQVGAVNNFESKSVRPGNPTSQPPKGNSNGGRAGAKSGQPHLGYRSGNHKGMTGGQMA